jgi:hypothetical protein
MKQKNVRGLGLNVIHYISFVLMLFSPTAIAALVSALTVVLYGLRAKLLKVVVWPFLFLAGTFFFSFVASYIIGNEGSNAFESVKFLLYGVCLVTGTWLSVTQQSIQRISLFLFALVVGWYALNTGRDISESSIFYPPDFNNSVVLLFFLAQIICKNRGILVRLGVMATLLLFSQLIDSRLLIILSPYFLLKQPLRLSSLRIISAGLIFLFVYYWSLSQGFWGGWSDQVRVALYRAVLAYFKADGISLIADGQVSFLIHVNANLPIFVAQRLVLVHAHNVFFQILGSYGLIALVLFTSGLLSLIRISIAQGNTSLRNQLFFLIIFMMIETVISDSRLMYIVFLLIGMQIRNGIVEDGRRR